MSDDLTDVVQPDDGQGDGGQAGDPPYADYLSRIPEDARDDVEPIFKEWDANVAKKFEQHSEFRKQWEPLQETGVNDLSPEEVAWLVQFRGALEDPQIMQQWWEGYARENGLTPAEAQEQAEQLDDFGFTDPSQQLEKLLEERLNPLMQRLEQVDGRFQQQDQQQAIAEAGRYIDGQIQALEKEHGKFDEETRELVDTFAARYIETDPMNAINKGFADLQKLLNSKEKETLQGKLGQPAPAESGGIPDVTPPTHKRIDSPDVKNAAMEWVRNQNRA